MTSVQDGGRPGWRRFGVPPSGPVDRRAVAAGRAACGGRTRGLEGAPGGALPRWSREDVDALVDQLLKADLVVGFNVINFDYEVLSRYTVLDLAHTARTLDMLVEIEKVLGHRLSLDSVATATLGVGKTGDGLDAIRWWREGRLLEIAEYCCFDVKCTKLVHEHGATHRQLQYVDKFRNKKSVAVQWS
jgi:DEAD/DEAH box helicase domain-containing protein